MSKNVSLRIQFLLSFFVMTVIAFGIESEAQSNTKKTTAKKKTVSAKTQKTQNQAQSKTVADLLKKIEKKSEKVNIKKSSSTLPTFQAGTGAAANVNLREIKPPASSKLYYDEGTNEAELMKVTDEGIEQLFNLTKRYTKSSKRGELWLRLAEMYVEKSRLIEYQILNKYDSDSQAFQAGKLKQRPKLNLTPATAYNRKAIQLYEWFLRDFPKDPKVDQALFFLGFNYFELGEPKKGQSYYEQLTKNHPKSLYVSESNFALGEYHFENERWKEALPYYSQVMEQKNNRLYSFALYKTAWCYYKQNQAKTGLKFLETVVLEGRKTKGQQDKSIGGVSRIRLATEAIKDLILFFAEAGDPIRARAYFEDVVGQKSANANLARLGYFYSDTGNKKSAKIIFEDLISQDPNSIKSFDYKYAIVKLHGALSLSVDFKKELYEWIELYGPTSSWQSVNEKDKEAVKKANELMEGLLRNHVLQLHQVAQNSQTKSAQASANKAYELYFGTYSKASKIDEMHFFYGELLFDVGSFEKAAYHYLWVVDNASQSQYYDKALLNSLLAYEKRLPTDAKIKSIVGEATEPIEFTPEVKAFESAAAKFLQKAPNSENAVAVKYRLGALYYLFNQFDKAVPTLNEVVKKHPKTQYAKFAANHLLDIYNLKQDYEGLQQAANDILAVPELAKSDVGDQIKDIKLRTDFKLAKSLEDKKDFQGSAKAYESFALKNRASSLAPAALFNSAVNYEKSGDVLKAISMYVLVAGNTTKGNESAASKANKFLPALYEKTGQYEKAARLFDSYATKNPKDPIAIEYRYNSAVIYDALNMYNQAIKNYDFYLANSRNKDRFEVLFLIAKIHERLEQKSKAIAAYDKYLNSPTQNFAGIIEAHYTIAKIHQSLGRKKISEEWFGKTVAVQRRLANRSNNAGASYAAESKFNLVYNTYVELVGVRIPANPAQQSAAVQKKLALLNRLKDELKSVVAYDDAEYIVAALSTQGKALQHLYSSIISAPLPKGLKPDELTQYKEGVQKIASPFKEQAIETYKTAVTRGYELQGYNDFLIEATKGLSALQGNESEFRDTQVLQTNLVDYMGLK